jgi:hypothetical protein
MPAVGAYRGRRARNQGDSASALPLRALASTCGSCATSQHAASEARVSGRTAHTAQRAGRTDGGEAQREACHVTPRVQAVAERLLRLRGEQQQRQAMSRQRAVAQSARRQQ